MTVTDDPSFASLYRELRQIAQSALRRSGSHLGLSPTTLLHEAYLDISRRQSLQFPDRAHFMAYASRAMRGLIIDYARERRAQKRGGGFDITDLPDGRSRPRSGRRRAATIERRVGRAGDGRCRARGAGGPEVLLRLLVRGNRCHALDFGAHRAAATGARRGCICTIFCRGRKSRKNGGPKPAVRMSQAEA